MAGQAIRVFNFCHANPNSPGCPWPNYLSNSQPSCNQSSITFNPLNLRLNSLFNIYCKSIASNIQNATQTDLVSLSAGTMGVFTIFTRSGNTFTRFATTVPESPLTEGSYNLGQFAIGTTLSTSTPAYSALISGQSYQGPEELYGQNYDTIYWKINDYYYGFIGNYL
jgi:hypothetical protein